MEVAINTNSFLDEFKKLKSMKQIQEWLGHSDFSTTANIYAHLEYDSKVSSANAMLETININI